TYAMQTIDFKGLGTIKSPSLLTQNKANQGFACNANAKHLPLTFRKDSIAQGTIEYLVIIAVVIVISLAIVGLSTNIIGAPVSNISSGASKLGSKVVSGGISILESVASTNGTGLVSLQNNSGDSFSVSKISAISLNGAVASADNNYLNVFVQQGALATFTLDSLGSACICETGVSKKTCTFEITLTSSSGLTKTQRITTTVDCVSVLQSKGNVILPYYPPFFQPLWAKGPSGTSSGDEVAYSTTVDSNGNVYIVGDYSSTDLNLGGSEKLTHSGSGSNFFVAKYNSSGNVLWLRGQYNTLSYGSYGRAVSVDAVGNVYVYGSSSDDLNFGNGVILTNTSNSPQDYFIVKYNSNGVAQWARGPYDSTSQENASSLVVDSVGNSYITGTTYGAIDFNASVNLPSWGGIVNFFVAKYDYNGRFLWGQGTVGRVWSSNAASGVAVDSSGNSYIGGKYYAGDLNFGGSVKLINTFSINGGVADFFVAKYDSGGNILWAKGPAAATVNAEQVTAVAVDSLGNLYAAGTYLGALYSPDLNFGGSVKVTRTSPNGITSFFLVKYDSSGNPIWAKAHAAGNDGDEYPTSINFDSSNNVYLAGYYNATDLNFGGSVKLTNTGGTSDFFLAKYDSSGNILSATGPAATTTAVESISDVVIDSQNDLYISGSYSSADLNFGKGIKLTNTGSTDFFITKYGVR
ncbi:MAG: hypothetical protein WCI04_04235, partial [archaeon]